MKRRQRAAWAVVGLVLAGCVPRVQLPEVPSREAPLVERQRAWSELVPTGRVDRVMTKYDREIGRWAQFVELGNGQTVAHPADFLPAVLPGSLTAQHAASFTGHKRLHSISILIASSILAVGLGVTTGSLFMPSRSALPGLLIGVAIMMSGGLSYAWTIVESAAVHRARDAAFGTYPPDLAERLGLSAPP